VLRNYEIDYSQRSNRLIVLFQLRNHDWVRKGHKDKIVSINSAYSKLAITNQNRTHCVWLNYQNNAHSPVASFRSGMDRDLAMFRMLFMDKIETKLSYKEFFNRPEISMKLKKQLSFKKLTDLDIAEYLLGKIKNQPSVRNRFNSSPYWDLQLSETDAAMLMLNKRPHHWRREEENAFAFSLLCQSQPEKEWMPGVPNSLLVKSLVKGLNK
jgi:hypothetical protein